MRIHLSFTEVPQCFAAMHDSRFALHKDQLLNVKRALEKEAPGTKWRFNKVLAMPTSHLKRLYTSLGEVLNATVQDAFVTLNHASDGRSHLVCIINTEYDFKGKGMNV